jgi:hypothetical protein
MSADTDPRGDPAAAADQALARTLLLLRDHVRPEVPEATLGATLRDLRVALVADAANLASEAGQHALVTTALLIARSGATVELAIADVRRRGVQVPLVGDYLGPALVEGLNDLVPGVEARVGSWAGADLTIVLGDTRWVGRTPHILRLSGNAWAGAISAGRSTGSRWRDFGAPLGALSAAGLAATEAFKLAVAPLRPLAIDPAAWDLHFDLAHGATVRLAPDGTPAPSGVLGRFDCVSGGAIIQAALYALLRIPGVHGEARVIEPERGDLTNLNRYALLRRSRLKIAKAEDVANWAAACVGVTPVVARYDDNLAAKLGPLAPTVLVGVDDIPSRWRVQAARPAWLGIGATSHYSAMASVHVHGWGCAQCLHPRDEPGDGPIPTVSFVSHWAGLWLASYFLRARTGLALASTEQSVFMSPLRADASAGIWFAPVPPRSGCPQFCAA